MSPDAVPGIKNAPKYVCGWGSLPDTAGGAYGAPPEPTSWIKRGLLLKGGEGKGREAFHKQQFTATPLLANEGKLGKW